jgi:heavy metal sensor kinase
MNLRARTLRGRLTLWYSGVLTALLALLGSGSFILLTHGLQNTVDDSLDSLAHAIADSVRQPPSQASDLAESLQSLLGPELAERFVQLLDPFGHLDPRLAPQRRSRLPLNAAAWRSAQEGRATYETIALPAGSSKTFRLLTMPVIRNGATANIVQVAMSLETVEGARSRFVFILLGLSPLVLAGGALGGWFLARRALAPVDAIVQAAQKIEAEQLSKRIPVLSQDAELSRLTAVLNDMLERIDVSFAAVRRFSADAAHELRTPLTILKGEIEVALSSSLSSEVARQTLLSCLEEVDRLNSLVEDLLLMARIDSNALSLTAVPVNLADIMDDVAPALKELAARAGNTCKVNDPSPCWVQGSEPLLFRLVFNLAENAIKYTPAKGMIEVSLRQNDSAAVWEVKDTGPGMTPEVQEHLFERFYRGDPAREGTGTGLGLAVVRSIVQLHRGQIEVSSTLGRGTSFRVTLPLVPARASPPLTD